MRASEFLFEGPQHKPVSSDQINQWAQQYANGLSMEELGRQQSRSAKNIAWHLQKLPNFPQLKQQHDKNFVYSKSPSVWDKEKIDQLKQYKTQGLSIDQIAQKFGMGYNQISNALYKFGLTTPMQRLSQEKIKQILQARQQGMPATQIIKNFGISQTELYRVFKDADVAVKKPRPFDYTSQDLERIAKEYAGGTRIADLAKKYNTNQTSLFNRISRMSNYADLKNQAYAARKRNIGGIQKTTARNTSKPLSKGIRAIRQTGPATGGRM